MIEIDSLTKKYGHHTVVDNLSFRCEPGEVLGFLGPNGAGKSTTMKMITGFVAPSAGSASVCGHDIESDALAAKQRLGYLPEGAPCYPEMTPRGFLNFVADLRELTGSKRSERLDDVIGKLHLEPVLNQTIDTLSKGFKRRVGLAQAILHDPDVLILDEPTDGVDPVGRREIRDLLVALRDQGKTIFLNSHLLSEVEQVCTRVAILNQGRLVREGSIEALTTIEPVYEVLSTPIPEGLLAALAGAIDPLDDTPPQDPSLRRYRIKAADRRTLNALLDRLRSEAVLFEAVHPIRQSLEDYFIEVVTDGV